MSPEVLSAAFWIVRTLLVSMFGGYLVAHGIVAAADVQVLAGNTTTVIFAVFGFSGTIFWGWRSRRRAAIAARLSQTDTGRALMAQGLAITADGRSRLIAKTAGLEEIRHIVADPATATAQPSDKVVPPGAS